MIKKPVVGERIMRQVIVESDLKSLVPVYKKNLGSTDYEPNDKGYVFRALRVDSLGGGLMAMPRLETGLVCFCQKAITDEHTHFVIVKVQEEGRWCICEPQEGSFDDLFNLVKTPEEVLEVRQNQLLEQLCRLPEDAFADLMQRRVEAGVAQPWTCGGYEQIQKAVDVLNDVYLNMKNFSMNLEDANLRTQFLRVVQRTSDVRSTYVSLLQRM